MMLDGMSDSIQRSRIENLQSREVDRQSPTGLIFFSDAYLVLINVLIRSILEHYSFTRSHTRVATWLVIISLHNHC